MTQDTILEVFNDIAGYQAIKEDAISIVDMIINEDKYISRGARFPNGFLLYGDPGMGKTKIVKAISVASGCPLLEISEGKAIEQNVSIDKLLVDTFEQGKKRGKCIILIDEIDKFAGYKKFDYEVADNLQRQKMLMQELDSIGKDRKVIVIATANDLGLLSDSFLRSGRFDRMLKFHYPSGEDRKAIFQYYTQDVNLDKDIDIENLVLDMSGCSCSDIECIANEAVINSVKRRSEKVSLSDIIGAMRRVTLRDIPNTIQDTESEKYKATAYHEAGHAFVSLYYKKHLINASILPQGDSDGYVSGRLTENRKNTKESLEQDIQIALAGGIATEVFLGLRSGGNMSDLAKASKLVHCMCEEGFYGYENCMFMNSNGVIFNISGSETLLCRRQEIIVQIFNRCDQIVRTLFDENSMTVKRIAEALMQKQQLDYNQLIAIMNAKEDKAENDISAGIDKMCI